MNLAEERAMLFAQLWPGRVAKVVEVASENYDDPELHSAPEIGSFCVGIYESLYPFSNYVCFYLEEVELSAQGGMGNEYTASVDGDVVIFVGETLRKVLKELPGDAEVVNEWDEEERFSGDD